MCNKNQELYMKRKSQFNCEQERCGGRNAKRARVEQQELDIKSMDRNRPHSTSLRELKEESYTPTTSTDTDNFMRIAGIPKSKPMYFSDLRGKRMSDVLRNRNCIMLIKQASGIDHCFVVIRHRRRGLNNYELFDSMRCKLDENDPQDACVIQSFGKSKWFQNKKSLQREDSKTSTCEKWAILRMKFGHMDSEAFESMFLGQIGRVRDKIVSLFFSANSPKEFNSAFKRISKQWFLPEGSKRWRKTRSAAGVEAGRAIHNPMTKKIVYNNAKNRAIVKEADAYGVDRMRQYFSRR
jgi:hypothetical protein